MERWQCFGSPALFSFHPPTYLFFISLHIYQSRFLFLIFHTLSQYFKYLFNSHSLHFREHIMVIFFQVSKPRFARMRKKVPLIMIMVVIMITIVMVVILMIMMTKKIQISLVLSKNVPILGTFTW